MNKFYEELTTKEAYIGRLLLINHMLKDLANKFDNLAQKDREDHTRLCQLLDDWKEVM